MNASRNWLPIVATLAVALTFVARPGVGADSAPPVLRELTIVPEVTSIEIGATQPYVAIGTYSDGVRKDVTSKAKWSSSNRKRSTMTADGTAAGVKSGKVTITAAIGTIKAKGQLTILPRLKMVAAAGVLRLAAVAAVPSTPVGAPPLQLANAHMPPLAVEPLASSSQEPVEIQEGPAPARPPYLQSISIEPRADSLPTGQSKQLTATARYSDGALRDITSEAVWSSSDVQVARAGQDGSVLGIGAGMATVTATLDTVSAASTLTVTPTISRIAIDPEMLTIKHHASGRLSAIATMTDGSSRDITSEVTWTSSNDSVTSVSVGAVAGNTPGSASITATLETFSASAAITVEPVIQSVSISPSSVSLEIGQSASFTASCTYSDGSTGDVTSSATWDSSNGSVATVNGSGGVVAIGGGTATIRVSVGNASATTSVIVATPPPPPDANPPRRRVAPH